MKVLIHTDEYYPTAQACSYRMQVFADVFTALGDEVTVITSSANKANGAGNGTARRERIIYAPAIRMRKKTTIMRMVNNLSFGLTSIFSAIGAGKADVVLTTSPPPLVSVPGWIIARCKGAKLIYDVRDIWPDVALEMGSFGENSLFCRIFRGIAGFMYRHADVVTTVSPGKVEKIRGHVRRLSGRKAGPEHTGKVWQVENGFDEEVAASEFDQAVVDLYELDRKFTCVYIGNIGLAQGLGAILDVAAKTRHRDVRFLCFGMGAEKEALEKRAREEGLTNIRFCGVIEHSKVYSVLSRAKLSFIPLKSGSMKDSVPTKIYEALGLGCPVFLVAEGDSAGLVDETGLGRHVAPGETEKLVDVFDDMIDRYDELIAHRDEAIRLMHEKYSRQKIAEAFNRRLHELCGM
jgi:glycosyltransferase involved in cell wall biosynthesis